MYKRQGISFSPFVSGIIALSISESAFQAEIFRAGINSIKKAQWEAGSSLGLNFFKRLRFVILPQAIKNILPAIGNQFVYVLKMSSLVSIIGIGDLTRKANELVVTTYRPLEIYTFLILEYLVLILIVSYFVRKLEKNLKKDKYLIFPTPIPRIIKFHRPHPNFVKFCIFFISNKLFRIPSISKCITTSYKITR